MYTGSIAHEYGICKYLSKNLFESDHIVFLLQKGRFIIYAIWRE